MSDNIESLARQRAKDDCRKWSVKECLEEALRQHDPNVQTKCLLLFYEERKKDVYDINYKMAGCSGLEARGMMLTHIGDEIIDAFDL